MDEPAGATASLRLQGFLTRARRRLLRRRALEAALGTLPWSLAAAALIVLALRFSVETGLLLLDSRAPLAAAALGVAALGLAAAATAASARFASEDLALIVDRRLQTREALSTATWLSGSDEAEARAAVALLALGDRGPAEVLPVRRPPWRAATLSLAALTTALLVPLPGPSAAEPPAVAEPEVTATAREVSSRVSALAEDLSERDPPDSVRRLLEDVKREAESLVRAPATKEEAQLVFQRLAQAVQEERSRRQAADSGSLERALSSLERSVLTRNAARAAQSGDTAALEAELSSLAAAFREGIAFEERELERLSLRLQEAAAELRESSHGELADRLDEIAEALERGDLERAAELFEQLLESGALESAADDASAGRALEQTQALLQQALAQVGRARPDAAPGPVQQAAVALREAASALEQAGVAEPAGELREVAGDLDQSRLEEAAEALEELLGSQVLRQERGSAEADAAAREAERIAASALAAIREAQSGEGRSPTAWGGPRNRAGAPSIPLDWGVGSTNEASPPQPLSARGNQSDRQSDETSAWVEAYEALYESTRLEEAKGRATRVRGEVGEGEHVAVPVFTHAEGPGRAQAPPVHLPPSYQRASEEALAGETIPAAHVESVRKYFESLGAGDAPVKGDPE